MYFFVCQADTAPDVLECRARVVCDLLLGEEAAVDLVLERRQRLEIREIFLQAVRDLLVAL